MFFVSVFARVSSFTLLFVATLASCRNPAERHPISDSVVVDTSQVIHVSLQRADSLYGDSPMKLETLVDQAEKLHSIGTDTAIGALDGRDELMFGRIDQAEITTTQQLLVLDGQASQLKLFTINGKPLQTLGGAGQGPGEYQSPMNFSASSTDTLAVFESNGRIHLYSMGPDSISFSRFLDLKVFLNEGCLMNGQLVIHGIRKDSRSAFHVFGLDGQFRYSFGEIYRTPDRRLRDQLSNSEIECIERDNIVIAAPVLIPQIRAYEVQSGKLLWTVSPTDYKPIDIRVDSDGSTRNRIPSEGYHGSIELHVDEEGSTIVYQFALVTPESREKGELANIHTLLVSRDGGGAFYVGDSIARLRDTRGGSILFSRKNPFPQLLVGSE